MKFKLPQDGIAGVSVGTGKTFPVKNRIVEITDRMKDDMIAHTVHMGWLPADDEAANAISGVTNDRAKIELLAKKAQQDMADADRERAAAEAAAAAKK